MNIQENWRKQLGIDAVPVLLASSDEALVYFVKRDLLDEPVEPISFVWGLPAPQKIIKKQIPDGSWKHTGKETAVYPPNHYRLVETFKHFRLLVEKYRFTREHPSASKAAEYLFSFQTADGDIRGFIGNQYATYYTGYVLSLLIKAGYADDPRVEKGLQWLLSMRQDDGGWTVPMITHELDRETQLRLTSQYAEPLEPDRSKPFSHNWTNMILPAFAAHPGYRKREEVRHAGTLLKSRFFMPDVYSSYKAATYWVRFVHWWPNLLMALESLLLTGFTIDDPDIQKALDWFIEHQGRDGLWNIINDTGKGTDNDKDRAEKEWLSLAICRVFKGFFS
jgi:hypothetical protein